VGETEQVKGNPRPLKGVCELTVRALGRKKKKEGQSVEGVPYSTATLQESIVSPTNNQEKGEKSHLVDWRRTPPSKALGIFNGKPTSLWARGLAWNLNKIRLIERSEKRGGEIVAREIKLTTSVVLKRRSKKERM